MNKSIVLEKAIKFALRIVAAYKFLTEEKREFVMSRQLLLSGTYIAKHAKAALHSASKQGFSAEMYIAMQKALDTELWLMLLKEADFMTEAQHVSLNDDCVELIKLTSSISKTSRSE